MELQRKFSIMLFCSPSVEGANLMDKFGVVFVIMLTMSSDIWEIQISLDA